MIHQSTVFRLPWSLASTSTASHWPSSADAVKRLSSLDRVTQPKFAADSFVAGAASLTDRQVQQRLLDNDRLLKQHESLKASARQWCGAGLAVGFVALLTCPLLSLISLAVGGLGVLVGVLAGFNRLQEAARYRQQQVPQMLETVANGLSVEPEKAHALAKELQSQFQRAEQQGKASEFMRFWQQAACEFSPLLAPHRSAVAASADDAQVTISSETLRGLFGVAKHWNPRPQPLLLSLMPRAHYPLPEARQRLLNVSRCILLEDCQVLRSSDSSSASTAPLSEEKDQTKHSGKSGKSPVSSSGSGSAAQPAADEAAASESPLPDLLYFSG
ncbi:MAG: hypothetical protein SFZ03_01415 [Candidatus Melainabacteria bacterium]|nr:hypothetical protein [Candidatus Melainabacteria bacterium]